MSLREFKAEALDVAREGYADPVFFLRFFLRDWFPDTIPWFHRGILAILTKKTDFLLKYGEIDLILEHFVWKERPDDPSSPEHPIFQLQPDGTLVLVDSAFTLIKMPRGFSKTTLLNGYSIWAIQYQVRRFIVYVSETATHAEMQLRSVRGQLEANEHLIAIFGPQAPGQRQGKKWTDDLLETANGVVLAAKGRGAQIRGLNHNGQRPDFILFDDVEDKESVATDQLREKVRSWAYADVIPALPPRDPNAGLVALGTLLHAEALLQTFELDPQFHSITFSCINRRGGALWPEHMPLEKIEARRISATRVGQLNSFYMEYFNQLRNDDSAKFKSTSIIHEAVDLATVPFRALAIDPAISERPDAAFCALAVVGMSDKGRVHVLDARGRVGMSPREQIDLFFEMHQMWDPQFAGVEAIGYQTALIHLLREEMFRKKRYFEITPIKHSSKLRKDDRILGILQPRYAAGYVRHQRRFPELESQLLDFPNGKKDFPDVVAMAVSLLDPYAAQAADPDLDLGSDEYEPLEKVVGDWRSA